jgi:putative transposase
LVDGNGIPLSLVVGGAQRHDVKLLEPTLDGIVVDRPSEEEGLFLMFGKGEKRLRRRKEIHAIVLGDGW